mmetsp:Transcript_54409/g.125354  ORF Transcript_54409/g.125354 Transcript_54409/m.125354 type:complete len:843 (-) Transcript_54409:283-2811(-)
MKPNLLLLLLAVVSVLLYVYHFFGNASVRVVSSVGRMAHQHAVIAYDTAGGLPGPQLNTGKQLTNPQPPADELATPIAASSQAAEPEPPAWLCGPTCSKRASTSEAVALLFNQPARIELSSYTPRGTTLHFTFGSSIMMDFVKNWLHFVRQAALTPFLVGAADQGLLKFCDDDGVPAAAITPELDVWTYERKQKDSSQVYEMRSEWKYFRHHNSDFLEMGLVKAAFLWELLSIGFHVLISDLDVVWLNDHWQRWMTHADPERPPVPEAALIALADVLVTTDEVDAAEDARGDRYARELNTGVVYFRCTLGSRAMVQSWRKSMLAMKGSPHLSENVNDQSLFNQVVRGGGQSPSVAQLLRTSNASVRAGALERLPRNARRVYQTHGRHEPCLPGEGCAAVSFSYGTLPVRPFAGGHTWFNQNVQEMEGHEQPQFEPITVHFTFQFGDTKEYPYGKRQRAREAALWAVDPPSYFTEGVFVALDGPTYTAEYEAAIYKRFPEWSPQRHMFMDAPQRQAIRDLLGLATAVDGIMVLPKLWCHCDRYWGFLSNCRFPQVPDMDLPFGCPQDALFETPRWNKKNVRFREHTFLDNPNVPATLRDNKVVVTVGARGEAVGPSADPHTLQLPHGTPMSEVKAAVLKVNPAVRLIEISNLHLRRLCRWLGSSSKNAEFNTLTRYILTESSRYCPTEDHGGYNAPGFDWQNPFTAYNCTWGFHSPTPFPEKKVCGGGQGGGEGAGVELVERPKSEGEQGLAAGDGIPVLDERLNSTTCPRQMLCDYNVLPDGRITKPITWCNIEGYNGMDQKWLPLTRGMLATMPDHRCPYPPGDRPGMLGFDRRGHYIGGS